MKNKPFKHKDLNTFKFTPFSERILKLNIDVIHRVRHKNESTETERDETYLHKALCKWNVLNLTEGFEKFRSELPAVDTLPLLLLQKEKVVDVILRHLDRRDPLALQAVLECLSALVKDLRREIFPSFGPVLQKLTALLSTKDGDQLEWTFTCLSYLFKYLWRYILDDLSTVFGLLLPLLSNNKPVYINKFAAESFVFVARKVTNRREFLELILKAVKRNPDGIEGCGRLLFETLRGIDQQFHSTAADFLHAIIQSLYFSPNRKLLYDVLKHTVSAMCAGISPIWFSSFWAESFRMLEEVSHRCTEGRLLHFSLMKQAVEYRNGYLLHHPGYIGLKCCKLLRDFNDKETIVAITEICIPILMSNSVKLQHEEAHSIVSQIFMINNGTIKFDFVCKVLEYAGFEIFIRPWIEKYVSAELLRTSQNVRLKKSLLKLLTCIVLKKAPPCLCGINFEDWKPYLLDVRSVEVYRLFEEAFCKACENACLPPDPSENMEDIICFLCIIPNMKLNSRDAVLGAVIELRKRVSKELETFSGCVHINDTLELQIQRVLLLYCCVLEAETHLRDSRDVEETVQMNEVQLLLPYIGKERYISALYALDLYVTVYSRKISDSFRQLLFNMIYSAAVNNLSSPFHFIRITTAHLLSQFKSSVSFQENYEPCFRVESIPVTIEDYRKKLVIINSLNYEFVESCDSSYKKGILSYLLGMFYVNFQLLWEPVTSIVASYARGAPDTFWGVFGEALKMAALRGNGIEPVLPVNVLFDCSILNDFYHNALTFDDKPDYVNYRELLWKALATFPEVCEVKSRLLTPLFIDLIGDASTSMFEKSYFCDIKKREENTCSEDRVMRKQDAKYSEMFRMLLAHMLVFSKIRNPKSMYRQLELCKFYYDALSHSNDKLQKLALDCLMNYKEKYLVPYSDHLYGLLDDKQFKTVITSFSIDKETSVVEEEHRSDLMPVVLRLLYGRMLTKTGKHSTGKSSSRLRRSTVLRFIAGCKEKEVMYFLQLAFGVYEQYAKDDPAKMVSAIQEQLDLSSVISLKKLRSSISMLDIVIDTLGSLMGDQIRSYILEMLLIIGAIISGVDARREEIYRGFLTTLRSLKSESLNAIRKFFGTFPDFSWEARWINAVFLAFVWPNLEKLPSEGTQNVTAILRLFITWAQNQRYFNLFIKHKRDCPSIHPMPFIMDLLASSKSRPSVKNAVVSIVESLLTLEDADDDDSIEEKSALEPVDAAPLVPVDMEKLSVVSKRVQRPLNHGTELLLPYIPIVIEHLRRKLELSKRHKKRKLSVRDSLILSCVCELVVDAETSESLLTLLVPIIQKEAGGSELTAANLITTLCYLLRNVRDPYQFLKHVAPLFGCVSTVGLRKDLCGVLLEMVEKDWVHDKSKVKSNVNVIVDINSMDKKWVEQPDFSRRTEGFKQIHSLIEADDIILEYGLIAVYHCFYILKSEKDLSLKDLSSFCLRKLTPFLCLKAAQQKDYGMIETVLGLISLGIRDDVHSDVQYQSVMILGELVRECPSVHPVLQQMDGLCSRDDPEVDFFNNIVHLQSHRKTRALLRFCEVSEGLTKKPTPRTLTQFILPIVSSFLCSERYSDKNSIIHAAIKSVSVVCRLLPCHQYLVILRFYLDKLRSVPLYQKQLVKIVVAILDAFHFDLSLAQDREKTGSVGESVKPISFPKDCSLSQRSKENPLGLKEVVENGELEEKNQDPEGSDEGGNDGNDGSGDDIPQDESVRDGEDDEDDTDDGDGQDDDVVENSLVEDACTLSDTEDISSDEAEVEAVPDNKLAIEHRPKLTPSAATRVMRVVASELLPRLHETIGQYTNTEKMHKGNHKRLVQDQGEEDVLRIPVALAVIRLLQQLPPEFLDRHLPGIFSKLCTFLKSRLESVRRVTRDTLKKIMEYLGPKYLELLLSEMTSLLTKGFQLHVLIFTAHSVLSSMMKTFEAGDMDNCLTLVLQICQMDLFGQVAEEKCVSKIVGKVSEARSSKTYDTLYIAAQYITEKCLVDLLLPFKNVVCSTNAHSVLSTVKTCLRRISLGLASNNFVPIESLLTFAVSVASDSIPALKSNKFLGQHHGKACSKTMQRPDSFLIPPAPRAHFGATAKPVDSSGSNLHMLVEFGLKLFQILLRRKKIPDEGFVKYVDPVIPLLCSSLDSKHTDVTTIALNCLGSVLKTNLPSLEREIHGIVTSVFNLLHKYAITGLSRGDHMDMVAAAFKVITVIIRSAHCDSISPDEIRTLLLYVEQDVNDHRHHATAFPLLKAILLKKYASPELETVIKRICELGIISQSENVRAYSRQICRLYVLHYPLGQRVDHIVDFFIAQLKHEGECGRKSAIAIIKEFIMIFSDDYLRKSTLQLLLNLASSLICDVSPTCREQVAECIKALISRSDHDLVFDTVLGMLREEMGIRRRLGAQLCGLIVEVEEDNFVGRLHIILPILESQLIPGALSSMPGKFVRLNRSSEEMSEKLKKEVTLEEDQRMIIVLELTRKICVYCPSFLTSNKWRQNIENIADLVQNLLGHDHEWVRLKACVILGHVFSRCYMDVKALAKAASSPSAYNGNFLSNHTRAKVRSLILDLSDQLVPGELHPELVEQVMKNLTFLARVVLEIPEDEGTGNEALEPKLSMSWMIQRMKRIIHAEMTTTPSVYVLRKGILTWIGAVAVESTPETLRQLTPRLLPPVVHEIENTSVPDVTTLAQGIVKIFKKKLGTAAYTEFLSKLQMQVSSRRAIRKRERAQLAIHNPELAAKRKIHLQQKKKEYKRKKMASLKDGTMRKKRKRNEDDENSEVPRKVGKWQIRSIVPP